jgi:hypothetical protein
MVLFQLGRAVRHLPEEATAFSRPGTHTNLFRANQNISPGWRTG